MPGCDILYFLLKRKTNAYTAEELPCGGKQLYAVSVSCTCKPLKHLQCIGMQYLLWEMMKTAAIPNLQSIWYVKLLLIVQKNSLKTQYINIPILSKQVLFRAATSICSNLTASWTIASTDALMHSILFRSNFQGCSTPLGRYKEEI